MPTYTSFQPGGQKSLTGITYKIASVCVFVVMASLLKASQGVPAGQLVFFRSFFAILPVIMLLVYLGLILYFRSRGGYKPVVLDLKH